MTYAVTDKYKTALEGKELSDQTAVETNLKAISAASKSDTAKCYFKQQQSGATFCNIYAMLLLDIIW